MATSLPRITPRGTPVPGAPRSFSANSMYVSYPPPHLTSTMDFLHMPPRINPLAPPPPRKRINASWETIEQHLHNDRRRIFMQAREHERYHSAWAKGFYGPPAEREAYRKHFREVLKEQMSYQDYQKKQDLKNKIHESEVAVEYDKICLQEDTEKFIKRYTYLKNFRDGNKVIMENQWRENRVLRQHENKVDREMMKYNPINWSCTLK
ncbi:uncharacterized protein LOC121367870 [Gigantopelta aegis]|uniref:uncharacterized protein LOC121367870 n=1 Tax=Gigantopelta aegis TaxID=1735272 RepID=UPI001B88D7CD|nr:uncharacterized protein LOC121367870 [Gigantopelta aegis]